MFLFIMLGGIYSLLGIQVIRGDEYFKRSLENIYLTNVEIAPRGRIVTDDGKVVAFDEKTYTLEIDTNNIDIAEFSQYISSLSVSDHAAIKVYEIPSKKLFDELKEIIPLGRGVTFVERTKRRYPFVEEYSHVVGYLGEGVSESYKSDYENSYGRVGKMGLERYYDSYLVGVNAFEVVVGDGGDEDRIELQRLRSGYDLHTTIDSRWQHFFTTSLRNSVLGGNAVAGSVVVLKSETGEVKTMVSYPGFDAEIFGDTDREDEVVGVLKDDLSPMLNRATSMVLSPGSTFKPIVAVAGLDSGVINVDQRYVSRGCEDLSDTVSFCEADGVSLGSVNVVEALGRSSNLYFCNVGRSFEREYSPSGAIQELLSYVDRFDFVDPTEIDLLEEYVGGVSTPEYVWRFGGRYWSIGDMCNMVIGQGFVTVTPLRMAVTAASLVNGGNIVRPYIVSYISDGEDVVYKNSPQNLGNLGVDDGVLAVVSKGMEATVSDSRGTANSLVDLRNEYKLRIKTGSADATERIGGEVYEGAHSWVIGTFNLDGEDYSFAMVQQFGGRGYETLPIIKEFLGCLDEGDECFEVER
ncbi:hypothetical protein KC717_02345 [Candidatus Dojkabacteria bacterium]|uniref:beta-lactamase n=1 Tax=Candidatus Dojkabacteria bacterium TaxID=2099670 RepID=A0A955RKH9_9BACT|nr:hypothetical protein [Candidatus Dojkabacteria bacterium]